ncbi:MAG: type III secretion system export apparatus subunit SctU [Chromatiaceae bacterium]|nr:type III secretion system export apparatus subunit SctU [Chromatiaceae bacterium]MCP5315847.1 type III secretion system export apparatus subunit SctU [Chromatiaceae bacterium]
MSEKTEQPTPKKLRDARKKGQVASSKEISSAALILSMLALLWGMSDMYMDMLREMILLPTEYLGAEFRFALHQVLHGVFSIAAKLVIPVILLVIVVSVLSHVFQYGLLFALQSLKPDINKLNPMQGVKKIVSLKNLVEFAKSVFKILFLSILLFLVIRSALPDLVKITRCGLGCIPVVLGALLKILVINAAFVFIIIAAADFVFQKFLFIKKMKMTKEEVKREYKEMEGDPFIKGKRRQLHQEMLAESVVHSVKHSSVVITNPTRIAIALDYREGETPLPIVRAKGENLIAKRIIEIAREEGIPVMENVPLARALHEQTRVDQYIPPDLIEAVAEVLRWVQRLEQQKAAKLGE